MRFAVRRTPLDRLLRRFWRDDAGNYIAMAAILMTVLGGFAGLATDVGLWTYKQQSTQAAADAAAVSAAKAYSASMLANIRMQADAVTAAYGFVANTKGVTVTVNQPPKSGSYTSNPNAIEVIVRQPQARLFSALWGSQQVTAQGRAVAIGGSGQGCVLVLDPSAAAAAGFSGGAIANLTACALYSDSTNGSSVELSGGSNLSALAVVTAGNVLVTGGSTITAVEGVTTAASPLADPYAGVAMPPFSGCTATNLVEVGSATLNPGVYCNGLTLTGSANVILNPGVYYFDRGLLDVNGGATLTGVGVTLVFTSSTGTNYATADFSGGAIINLTAPVTGPFAGIVIFGDRAMPIGTNFTLTGGSMMNLVGAVYLPSARVTYTGGSSSISACTQLIADTISFSGVAAFAINCAGKGTAPIGSSVKLVE